MNGAHQDLLDRERGNYFREARRRRVLLCIQGSDDDVEVLGLTLPGGWDAAVVSAARVYHGRAATDIEAVQMAFRRMDEEEAQRKQEQIDGGTQRS